MTDARGPSRRAVLVGSAGVVAAGALPGCSAPAAPPPPPPPDPDDAVRAAASARERDLLLAYDAALVADPTLAPTLSAVRAHHEEHLAALVAETPPPSGQPSLTPPAPTPTPAPAATPAPGPTAPAVGTVSLAALAAAERVAAARHADDAVNARDRGLAALLASLSASEQSHPVALS